MVGGKKAKGAATPLALPFGTPAGGGGATAAQNTEGAAAGDAMTDGAVAAAAGANAE